MIKLASQIEQDKNKVKKTNSFNMNKSPRVPEAPKSKTQKSGGQGMMGFSSQISDNRSQSQEEKNIQPTRIIKEN